MSGPPTKMRKWNQFSQFRQTSSKVILMEKARTGYHSTMSQGFTKLKLQDQQFYILISIAYPTYPLGN